MVWAFTELMVDRNLTTGFIDYYRWLNGNATPVASERMVRMLAPIGCGGAHLYSGRDVTIWDDRIVEMNEEDARPLLRAGWVHAPTTPT
jgi:hypothetical protein